MKKKIVIVAAILSIVVSGCIVRSIHPFYHEEDVVFKKELLGTWMDSDSSVWKFSQNRRFDGLLRPEVSDNSYDVVYSENENDTSYFHVHLFTLKGNYYLDFMPEEEKNIGDKWASYHFIPTHSIARLEFISDHNISFFWFGEEWLENLFEQNKVRISHEYINTSGSYEQYILTAETDELQKFIVKFGSEIDYFENINFDSIRNVGNGIEIQNAVTKEMENYSSFVTDDKDVIFLSMRKIQDLE